ncbi:hypothetical protein AcV5_004773 [Taiwanofungus camphoratus]|nr:hypothetical protein AcW2_000628 [Antrodia cinnamomea]KAI0936693.1 hypothetical protein AcV5_004773 [Antrodia cinnamomea]
MSSPPTSCLPSPALDFTSHQAEPHCFTSSSDLLQHVTRNWRLNFVTVDLNTMSLLEGFVTRPFFLVVSVDAPLLVRYKRTTCRSDITVPSLEEFIREHDIHFYGMDRPTPPVKDLGSASSTLLNLNHFVNLHIVNSFDTVASLHTYLDDLDLLNAERLRPGWDVYFMQLASLASQRSNCMKRRVGAILVRNKRILATGYNGTPRGLKNCNEGGCVRCNSANETSDECVCLHAEENALLEAGRERIGDGAVLYCNTCPCLKCTIKIIQTGVREVVYNLGYKVDDDSAALFQEAGVVLRRHATPS